MSWTIEKRQIENVQGNVIPFPYDIKETLEVNGILVVLLEVPPDRVMTENVFAISSDGKLLWQIAPTAGNSTDPVNTYTGFTGHGEGTVRIFNWNGTSSLVDLQTGKVLATGVAK
jgi:hypothetical protein